MSLFVTAVAYLQTPSPKPISNSAQTQSPSAHRKMLRSRPSAKPYTYRCGPTAPCYGRRTVSVNRRSGQRRFDPETRRSGASRHTFIGAPPVFALWATTGSLRCFAEICKAGLPAVAAKQRRLVPWRTPHCLSNVLLFMGEFHFDLQTYPRPLPQHFLATNGKRTTALLSSGALSSCDGFLTDSRGPQRAIRPSDRGCSRHWARRIATTEPRAYKVFARFPNRFDRRLLSYMPAQAAICAPS